MSGRIEMGRSSIDFQRCMSAPARDRATASIPRHHAFSCHRPLRRHLSLNRHPSLTRHPCESRDPCRRPWVRQAQVVISPFSGFPRGRRLHFRTCASRPTPAAWVPAFAGMTYEGAMAVEAGGGVWRKDDSPTSSTQPRQPTTPAVTFATAALTHSRHPCESRDPYRRRWVRQAQVVITPFSSFPGRRRLHFRTCASRPTPEAWVPAFAGMTAKRAMTAGKATAHCHLGGHP
jgi:hypothetical protein